jgi:hypothetical protein
MQIITYFIEWNHSNNIWAAQVQAIKFIPGTNKVWNCVSSVRYYNDSDQFLPPIGLSSCLSKDQYGRPFFVGNVYPKKNILLFDNPTDKLTPDPAPGRNLRTFFWSLDDDGQATFCIVTVGIGFFRNKLLCRDVTDAEYHQK